MFDHILIPLDGSVNAEKIAGWSEGIPAAYDSDLTLLSVVDPGKVERSHGDPGRDRPARGSHPLDEAAGITEHSGGIAYGDTAPIGTKIKTNKPEAGYGTQVIEQAAQERNSYVNVVSRRLAERGIHVRAMVTIGTPEDEILRVAEEEGIDLITMATHRESLFARGVLGSVTDRVIRQSTVPVLTMRPENISETVPHKPDVILVPLDGSEVSESVIPIAMNIARKSGSQLVFARVTSKPYQSAMNEAGIYYSSPLTYSQASTYADEYLEPFVEKAKSADIPTSMRTPMGNPSLCLIEMAGENENTLIVIGTRGQSGLKRLIVGSVTDKVIRTSGHPVLVVPPKPKTMNG